MRRTSDSEKQYPRNIVTKAYLCQSLIVVTSTQHVNFSYSLHMINVEYFYQVCFVNFFILYKTYTIYLTRKWSCTHIPNTIDLSGKTKKLWSGKASLRRSKRSGSGSRSGRKYQTITICLPSFEKTTYLSQVTDKLYHIMSYTSP